MKKIICKNCGGEYTDDMIKCPYCGTMHKRGAYRNFRRKVNAIIDKVLGLKDTVEKSTSRVILGSIFRALVLVAVCVLLAFIVSRFVNVNYYNDREYDQKRYEQILWEDENMDALNAAFAKRDIETIGKLMLSSSSSLYGWEHYDAYMFMCAYKDFGQYSYNQKYALQIALYYLYYPEYYGRLERMSSEDLAIYQEYRDEILNKLIEMGYSETELRTIYDACKDGYGYISLNELEKYVKGENNG